MRSNYRPPAQATRTCTTRRDNKYIHMTVVENGEIHYSIIKHENGLVKLVESFDYNEYSQALKTLRDYNT